MNTQALWEDYAEKFNFLSNLMQSFGLDPKLLREVIEAAIKFYTTSHI